ncbi:MAG: AAA family ATPase [Lysobacterales bacterium]
MNEHLDLAALIRADTPLLAIETHEELEVIASFQRALTGSLRPLYTWSITTGLRRLDMDTEPKPMSSGEVLDAIVQTRQKSVFLLLDYSPFLRYVVTLRQLREIAIRQGVQPHVVALVGANLELPKEIDALAVRFSLSLPNEAELDRIVREEASNYSRENAGKRVQIHMGALKAVVRNLKGLAASDARRIARRIIATDGMITDSDLPAVAKAKFELLNKAGVLSFEYETLGFGDVAGSRRLKRWVEQRRPAFLGEPTPVPLDPPKGILLLGVQGTGKSLAAKAVAGGFQVPLLRMDMASIYNKYHGETERNLRESLANAEVMAPCVLWIDEIEKAFSTSDSDEGVSRRILGYFLTWMAERKAKIFLVATANAIEHLPPELLRKGRFDEIFFVDLPAEDVRQDLFRIHLTRRGMKPEGFDLAALAAASAGFSGAEIEQAVVSSLYAAHGEKSALDQRHLLDELRNTRPLSVVMGEKVARLRAWAAERTVPAD